jgi:hypothetical protein
MSLYSFLHTHLFLYWTLFAALLVALLYDIATHSADDEPAGDGAKTARADIRYAAFSVLMMFWGRFPAWLFQEQNPDEAQAIATAITLLHDPRFWITVDAGTHGPMVSLPLLIPKLFGARLAFAAARCVGSVMLIASFALAFDISRRRFGSLAAKLGLLPLAVMFSLNTNPDFMAYNGEMPVVFFLMLGTCLADRALACDETLVRQRRRLLIGAGVCLGLIPWVKLQGVPSAIVVASIVAIILYAKQVRELRHFAIALVGPSVVFMLYVLSIGALRDFYNGYLLFATQYGDPNLPGWEERLWAFLSWIASTPMIDAYVRPLGSVIALLVVGYISADVRRASRRIELGLAALLFAVCAYEVYRPGKPFAHYLILITAPGVILLAALLQGWLSAPWHDARRLVIIGYCAFIVIWPLPERITAAPITQHLTTKIEQTLAPDILHYARPGDRMLVWGWMASMHVYTQLPQAVRYADQWQIAPPEDDNAEFARVFMRDFDSAPVPLVVDAVAELSCCLKSREGGGYETFPPLAKRIERDYELVWDRHGLRLFVRKDRLSALQRRGAAGG